MSDPVGVVLAAETVRRIHALLDVFEATLPGGELRPSVLSLVPVVQELRSLGVNLIPREEASSARPRILVYLRKYQGLVINGDELYVVAGISEWARRVRELRVEEGWQVLSGLSLRAMQAEGELDSDYVHGFKTDDYVLVSPVQDRDAAHRWHLANTTRRLNLPVKDRILKFLRANVGVPVSGEELMYIAKNASDWPRRTRELRSEHGWPVLTRQSGDRKSVV